MGFWFSLGHSTVVVGTVATLAAGMHFLVSAIEDDTSPVRQATGLWGVSISVVFVLAFGMVNLHSLVRLVQRRRAEIDGIDVPVAGGGPTGLLFRLFRPIAYPPCRPTETHVSAGPAVRPRL
ncbi:hypothetical protein [Cryobacterium sp. TMS1-13-1]|uniref:HoxN/HupN/NixA family nickel/cobalt transporter n=1 Tax=Cryobacterium sp. TMS1-13-1 TaxID=1259220 RepID=UPI0010694354|nr:hypothetical protein E3T31_16495 [Cryobacterium sp. TMS1-13-1]